ncbi:MAG: 1,4-dihydroxy-6-naphthoate synthase [Saprospiraceae bacterium]|nr:1,4-dihydroxy-6-naphthoate synthase [Saprospiraceae bacterium]
MPNHKIKLTLAISPCPNDTFIFGHWILGIRHPDFQLKLDPPETQFLDIQELNKEALKGSKDVIKVSAAHAAKLLDHYQILNCGGALGLDCGPLLIGKKFLSEEEINDCEIILPGENTTARFLFDFSYPNAKYKKYRIFSEVEQQVLQNNKTLGVIIHESRFTYREKCLVCIKDLGKNWVEKTNLPIPLGLIMVRKDLPINIKHTIKEQIIQSIQMANVSSKAIDMLIKSHASEMLDKVIREHISLYVNSYSMDIGPSGRQAIFKLFKTMGQKEIPEEVFI